MLGKSLLSIRGEGVVATDMGVTSYWTDPESNELMNWYLPYERITSVAVSPLGLRPRGPSRRGDTGVTRHQ